MEVPKYGDCEQCARMAVDIAGADPQPSADLRRRFLAGNDYPSHNYFAEVQVIRYLIFYFHHVEKIVISLDKT